MQEHTPLWFLFQYKAHSNQEMLNAAQAACNDVSAGEMHALVRILNHTYVVDQIFSAHLRGEPHFYENTNTPETPSLEQLQQQISASDAWFLTYVDSLDEVQLQQNVRFQFTDGDTACMTRAEILHHVLMHGTYHRGAAGRILFNHNVAPPREGFARVLHELEPQRRF